MKKTLLALSLLMYAVVSPAQNQSTKRIEQFENQQVKVWKTIVYPSSQKALPMHRHDNNRVLVALTDGTFKVTNDKGQVKYITIAQGKAYFITKDEPNVLHNDENISKHTIKVMVIEIK